METLRRGTKIVGLIIALLMISVVSEVQASDFDYETVGGEQIPINFMVILPVPILVIIAVFGVMVIAGLIRTRTARGTN